MIQLGRFQLDLEMRTLWHDGEAVHLGSRAFDILAVVASAGGRLVTKDELMNAVWPETIVEENNIQVHLSALRKILGPDRDLILTVPGRGYQLLQRRAQPGADETRAPVSTQRRLPPPKAELVGRDTALAQIRAMLDKTHVLTLVGAGGIGKTSLAIEAARHAADQCADQFAEVCLVELAALTTHAAVLGSIAEACGLRTADTPIEEPLTAANLAAALAAAPRLLVLDNAEHVIGEVAAIVETLIAGAALLRVLVTSREPLRIMPEAVFRVDPLDVPPPHATDAEILRRSAVSLFLLRARSLQGKVDTEGPELRLVSEICRRLDGIPLAIELAAARVVTLGVEGVYRRLDDRMAILSGGYRTALPRHQTLRATFDWSFALLDASSQALFRRLATFGGLFTFEAMCAVACGPELTVGDIIGSIGELVAKSLVNVEFDGPVAKYRLTESTRAYASEKLQSEGEKQDIAARHARYLSNCFLARSTGPDRPAANASPDLQQTLDDARSAFDWAFSPEGDVRLGVELASNLAGALLDCGMIEECCTRASLALDAMESLPLRAVGVVSEMRVRAALASALPHIRGPVAKSVALWRDVHALAAECGDHAFQARALWGEWNAMISSGLIDESMTSAARFERLAAAHGTPWQRILADQLAAISLHCQGRHAEAKEGLLSAMRRFAALGDDAQHCGRFAVDPLVFANGTLARIAWLQGEPEEAMAIVDTLVDLVRPENIEPSLTHVLGAAAAPLALMSGDVARGARYLEIMRSQAALHRFEIWRDYCECLSAYGETINGRTAHALPVLEASIDALQARGFRRLVTPFIVACAEALAAAGRLGDAARRLNDTLTFCERHGERLFLPEIWRALAVVAQAEASAHARSSKAFRDKRADALSFCQKAIDLARAQGACMWELRASMAMARMLHADGHSQDASALLETFVNRFDPASSVLDIRALFRLAAALREHRDVAELSVACRMHETARRGLYSFSSFGQDVH